MGFNEEIIQKASGMSPISGTLLQDADFSFCENSSVLTVQLKKTGAFMLRRNQTDRMLEDFARTQLGEGVRVVLNDPVLEVRGQRSEVREKALETRYEVREARIPAPALIEKKPAAGPKAENKPYRPSRTRLAAKELQGVVTNLSEPLEEGAEILIDGLIFRTNKITTRTGRFLCTLDVTDGTDSITVKFFTKDEGEFERELSAVAAEGKAVRVRGKIRYDDFARELILMAAQIAPGKYAPGGRTDASPAKRVELHCHTHMSQMDAMNSVTDCIKTAAEFGMTAIAITDHGNVQAYPEAFAAGKKYGLKIIYGMEAYLVDDTAKADKEPSNIKKLSYHHAIILVKNQQGLRNLYELVSLSNIEYFYKRPRIPKSALANKREGLILGTACESGEFYRAVLKNEPPERLRELADFYDYIEIQTHKNNMYLVRDGHLASEEDLIGINKRIVELGETFGKPVAATCDVHFINPQDSIFREILMTGEGFKDASEQAPLFLRTTEEMLLEFDYLEPETARKIVIENTNLIAEMCEEIKPLPVGTYPFTIEGSDDLLRNISNARVLELYGESPPEIVKQRLEREMASICEHGFASLYNAARLLTERSLENGYLVGSRGSVGSSFAATMTGITEVNPLKAHYYCKDCKYSDFDSPEAAELRKILPGLSGCDLPDKPCPVCGTMLSKDGHEIMFEIFLGFDCDKEPDIDLNFSGEYQAEAHSHAEEIFGREYVFKAGTIGTLADKTAFGFVNGYLEDKKILKRAAERNRLIAGLVGVKRTTGQHPGGVIVIPRGLDIHDFCPIQRPADNQDSRITTTHFDYSSALEGRLMKLDILGHDAPTVIRLLHDFTDVDPHTVDIGDKSLMEIFNGTALSTLGIPEFGTGFVRQMLADTRPGSFTELVKISGLSHGTDVWLGNGADLVKSGVTNLNGIVAARDDILLYLMNLGMDKKLAFNIMENVRKGKGLTADEAKTMAEAGAPEWYIDSCRRIKYLFPKGHAVAYVMMSVRIAYYKLRYPIEFYCASYSVKTLDMDYTTMCRGAEKAKREFDRVNSLGKEATAKEKNAASMLELVLEMYQRGIFFLPMDIYTSHEYKFIPTEKGILPPLMAIPGLGGAAAQSIVAAREDGEFLSRQDFKERTKVPKNILELFVENDLLHGLPETNQLTLF